VAQVFRIVRRRDASEETAYGITSLSVGVASAERLLEISRRHWSIENSLHYVRDVTFLEDRCRTRSRNKAQILAAFRNYAITLIRQNKFKCVHEGFEYFADDRTRAINAVMMKKTE
jgi:predicted transposase YbfD/YdcC